QVRSVTDAVSRRNGYPRSPSLHLAWRSWWDTRVAIHPSTSVSSQPTVFVVSWRFTGSSPRRSRRQSYYQDSPLVAQTARDRRKRAGERTEWAGCSAVSVTSSDWRVLLISADATRWRIMIATPRGSR